MMGDKGPGLSIIVGAMKKKKPGGKGESDESEEMTEDGESKGPSKEAKALATDFVMAGTDEGKLARVFDSLLKMCGY